MLTWSPQKFITTEEQRDPVEIAKMIDNDFLAFTISTSDLDKVFRSLDFDLETARMPCAMKDFPSYSKNRMHLFTGRLHIASATQNPPTEAQLEIVQKEFFKNGRLFVRAKTLKVQKKKGTGKRRSAETNKAIEEMEPCGRFLSMGSLRVPFRQVISALRSSKIRKLRCYIPFNRKQLLGEFRMELGTVFADDKPLYESDTIADFGVSWRVPSMFVFGLQQTSQVKNCKVHSMHMAAGKGAGSLEFQFTDPALKNIKACIYPEAARWVKSSKRCAHTPVFTREAFRNQCNGQKMLIHYLKHMLQSGDLSMIQGYRVEYRVSRSCNIWASARVLFANNLFSWAGLVHFLTDTIQRMEITVDFLKLLPPVVQAAQELLWRKISKLPTEFDRQRMIEVWHFLGVHSGWQARSDKIEIGFEHWRRSRDQLQFQVSSSVPATDRDRCEVEAMANVTIPSTVWLEMEKRIKIRSCCKGCRVTVTRKGKRANMWRTFQTTAELFQALYNEWGDDWHKNIYTKY
jgi:hypothetical protein